MQLRAKEELRFMRSVTLQECCPESNRSASRSQDSSDEDDFDSPSIVHNSQNWNDIHLRLFCQESCVDCASDNDHSLNRDIVYEVSHYHPAINSNRDNNNVGSSVHYGSSSEIRQDPPHTVEHIKGHSTSTIFPSIDVDHSLRQGQQSSNLSMLISANFNVEDTSCNKKCHTLPASSQQNRHNCNPIPSLCQSRSLDNFNQPFSTNTLQSDKFATEFCKSFDLRYPTNQYSHLSRQFSSIANQQSHSNGQQENRECYQIEDTSNDRLLAAVNSHKRSCCAFSDSMLALLVCAITVIAFLALGSIIYISVTATAPSDSTTTSTSFLQLPYTKPMIQAEICGKKPKNFTVKKPVYEDSIPMIPLEEFFPVNENFDNVYVPNYDIQQTLSSLKTTVESVETQTESDEATTTPLPKTTKIVQLLKTTAKTPSTKPIRIRAAASNIKPRTALPSATSALSTSADVDNVLIRNRRVVGGQNAQLGTVPWQVSLWVTDGPDQHFVCGGSLVMTRWIVTAAHCTNEYTKPDTWRAYVGLVKLSRINDHSVQEGKVIYIYNHINYTDSSSSLNYDVSLFLVEKPFRYTDFIQPICLPPQGFELPSDADCYVSGWGYTYKIKKRNQHPDILQRAKINIVSEEKCNKWLEGKVSSQMLCAGEPQGRKDACTGDSGGPLSYFDHEKNVWILAGSVSWGDGQCGLPETPGVYAKMSGFSDWLWNTILLNDERQ